MGKCEMKQKVKTMLFILTIALVFVDLCYSFVQHYNAELDGDIPESALPLEYLDYTFSDPLGVKTIVTNTPHEAPNRFFSHYFENRWFNTVPFLLQKVSDPVTSVYLTCAVFKIIVQILLIYLLTVLTFGSFKPFTKWKHWLVILFYSALFQTCGQVRYMGIIDPAVTYTFFYAFPLLLLVVYLLPYLFEEFYDKKLFKNKILIFFWCLIFVILINFSGPTNTGTVLVFIAVMFLRYFILYMRNKDGRFNIKKLVKYLPKRFWIYLVPVIPVALYSLYLGTYNNMWDDPYTLKEKFLLLPRGYFEMFINNKGFSILTLGCIINTVLLLKKGGKGYKKTVTLFWYIIVFTFVYCSLLPIGGYRPYRPYILRYDTYVCVSFAFIFYEVYSSYILLNFCLKANKYRNIYAAFIILFAGYFFAIDDPAAWRNDAEKKMIYKIAQSKDKMVYLDYECTIISWNVAREDWQSEYAVRCLKRWNIIDKNRDVKFIYSPQSTEEK